MPANIDKLKKISDHSAKGIAFSVSRVPGTAGVADDLACRLWNAETGSLVRELRGHPEMTPHHFQSMLYACGWSADGKLLATADKVAKAIVWEVATGKQLGSVEAPVMYTWD